MSIENYGKYQLLKRLAMGGMAQIYLARRKGAGAGEPLLVVKRILPHLAENREFVQMFLDEARIAARLDHPNIVQIYDLGAQDDSFFIAMEYIHGEDLRRVWKRAERGGDLIPVPLVCRIMSEACSGLDHAHKKVDAGGRPLNIVHRDISPQNILLTFEGRAKVVDFGIAKAADQATVTRSGVLKGKYSYMSPEQAAGQKVDRRSDIFALGVVLYELLTGTRLFKRPNDMLTLQAVTECIIQTPSLVNPRVPKDLDALVMKALARESGDRYAEALLLQRALEDWLETQPRPASTTDVAAFMKSLYAERLAEEARRGDVVVEDAEGGALLSPKTGERLPLAPPEAALRTPSRPSRADVRTPSAERRGPDARRTLDLRRAPDPMEAPEDGPEQTNTTRAPPEATRAAPKDQPSISQTTATTDRVPPSPVTDEKTVSRPSRVQPSPPPPPPRRRSRRRAVWVGVTGIVAGLLLGALWALSTTPAPAVTAPDAPVTQAPRTETPPAPPSLPPEPTRVQLTLKVAPGAGRLTVDGKAYGAAPVVVSALPGQELTVLAEAPRHRALTRKVTVGEASTQETLLTLEPLAESSPPVVHKRDPVEHPPTVVERPQGAQTGRGTVRFAVTPWAEVSCGGRNLGSTPLPDVALVAGVYECKFSNPEMGTRTQRVEVKPNTHTRVVVKF